MAIKIHPSQKQPSPSFDSQFSPISKLDLSFCPAPENERTRRKIRRGAIKGGIRYISRWTESCTRYRNYAIPEQPSIYPRIVSILDGDPSVFGSPVWTIGQCSFSVQLFPITGRCVHEGKIGFDSWEDRWYREEIEFRKKLSVVSCTKFKI